MRFSFSFVRWREGRLGIRCPILGGSAMVDLFAEVAPRKSSSSTNRTLFGQILRGLSICVPAEFSVPFLLLGNSPCASGGGVEAGGFGVANTLISVRATSPSRASRAVGDGCFCSRMLFNAPIHSRGGLYSVRLHCKQISLAGLTALFQSLPRQIYRDIQDSR